MVGNLLTFALKFLENIRPKWDFLCMWECSHLLLA